MAPSLPLSCAAISAAFAASRRAVQQLQLLSKSTADLCRHLRSSTIWLSYEVNFIATWMHLHNCRCFQEHLRMLLQSLSALGLSPGKSVSIEMYLETLLRSRWVSGKITHFFWIDLHFADVSPSDHVWRMWRRISVCNPISETNVAFCWYSVCLLINFPNCSSQLA